MSKATGVKAEMLIGEGKWDEARKRPGAFFYGSKYNLSDTILHSCPCGCNKIGSLYIGEEDDSPRWKNTGTRDKPTLSPSVGIRPWDGDSDVEADGFHWHGWLRDGVWISV